MRGERIVPVVASVVRRPDNRVLLLKRSAHRTRNPGKWCFVTGYVEAGEDLQNAASRELQEELGIIAQPVRAGETVVVHTHWGDILHVVPYLFDVGNDVRLKLDEEHTEYVWIKPEDIYQYSYVQQLDEDLINLGLLENAGGV